MLTVAVLQREVGLCRAPECSVRAALARHGQPVLARALWRLVPGAVGPGPGGVRRQAVLGADPACGVLRQAVATEHDGVGLELRDEILQRLLEGWVISSVKPQLVQRAI